MQLKQILLVEDDERDLELTLAALEEAHFSNPVDVVRDGEEAVDYLFRRNRYSGRTSGNPSVILLDLKLPKLNGIEVLRQIRSSEEYRYQPVVMLTSSREDPDVASCYKYGVNAYVVKPMNLHEFMEAVRVIGAFWGIINELPVVIR